jgi:hypothetical protein
MESNKIVNSTVNEKRKREFLEQFSALGQRLAEYRKKNGIPEEPFTMDEIVAEVKKVRAEMYADEQNY